jgi:hypothetical protein
MAGLATVSYVTAAQIAVTDGPRGVEVPPEVSRLVMSLIIILVLIATCGWMFEQIVRAVVDREVRRIVVTELHRGFDDFGNRFQSAVTEVANTSRAVSVAEFRALLQEDVSQTIEAGLARAQRYGMVREAQNRAVANGDDTTVALVTKLRPRGN